MENWKVEFVVIANPSRGEYQKRHLPKKFTLITAICYRNDSALYLENAQGYTNFQNCKRD